MGKGYSPTRRHSELSRFLLDTTALIAHLRGESSVTQLFLDLLASGHRLGTCCVNVAEVERGLKPSERKLARSLMERLEFFETTMEAATRAGRYQAALQKKGRTLHTTDALVAGTARAYGAVLVTDNLADFPMADIKVQALPFE
ncbi:MAG: type II toxin-antitoxin system VapC family toxin [Actinomycetota bacterium]